MKILRGVAWGALICALLLIAGCALLPSALHRLNPDIVYRGPKTDRTLYLTIDDGPSQSTGLILDVLKKHGVHATFFIITDHIEPVILQRSIAEGNQLANHMKTSASLSRLSDEQFHSEFLAADKALTKFEAVKLFRPPGGSISTERARFVATQGYEIVAGTIFPLDHWLENTHIIVALAKALTIDGGIIILHDTNIRGPRTAAVLDELIPYLQHKGYRFELLPEKK